MAYQTFELENNTSIKKYLLIFLTLVSFTVMAIEPEKPAVTSIALPELPSLHEQNPLLWDEYNCTISDEVPPPGTLSCQEATRRAAKIAKAQPVKALPQEELNQTKQLRGFEGPYYTSQPSANAVVVLPETVTTSVPPSGGFSAVGLIRNELPTQLIGSATITAELIGASGKVIAKASTDAIVTPIRPGEPSPFELKASVPFKDVVDVRWRVSWELETNKNTVNYRNVMA